MKCCSCAGSTPWCTQTSTPCDCVQEFILVLLQTTQSGLVTAHQLPIDSYTQVKAKGCCTLSIIVLLSLPIGADYPPFIRNTPRIRNTPGRLQLLRGPGPPWSNFEVNCALRSLDQRLLKVISKLNYTVISLCVGIIVWEEVETLQWIDMETIDCARGKQLLQNGIRSLFFTTEDMAPARLPR